MGVKNSEKTQFSGDRAVECGRKGGIASAKARQKRKDLYQITNMMLNAELTGEGKEEVEKIIGEKLPDEALTTNALMIAGQIKSAINGNTKAFTSLAQFQELGKEEENEEKYTIPITDITKDFVEVYRAVHEAFEHGTYREIISPGGRGSIKSNFWSAVAEETIYNDPQAHVVYTRRFKVDLRGSVFHQFQKTIIRHGRLEDWEFTTSPMMAKYKKTGQCVIFVGADKPISLKSYNLPFGYVKLLIHEECDEMAGIEQMDNIEDTFLRNDVNALDVKVYNPPRSKNNFMNKYTLECLNKQGTFIGYSYYYNVPRRWLGNRFFERAEWFKVHKPEYYRNNYLGEVIGTGGGVFENIEEREISDEEIESFDSFNYGLDFGYVHPQVFIQCHYDDEKDIVYEASVIDYFAFGDVDFNTKVETIVTISDKFVNHMDAIADILAKYLSGFVSEFTIRYEIIDSNLIYAYKVEGKPHDHECECGCHHDHECHCGDDCNCGDECECEHHECHCENCKCDE